MSIRLLPKSRCHLFGGSNGVCAESFPYFIKVKFKNDAGLRGNALVAAKQNAEDLREYGVDDELQVQAYKAEILGMGDDKALD